MLTDQVLNNADLHLSDQERKQFYTAGMAHLQYLTSEQKAQVDANRPMVMDAIEAIRKDPNAFSEGAFSRIRQQAMSLGDSEGADKLDSARLESQRRVSMGGLSPEQQFNAMAGGGGQGGSERQALDFFTSKGWTPAQAAGIVGNLSRESGLRTGALNRGDGSDGSDSIGLGQWNGPRAAALKTFAGAQGKSVNDFGTQLAFVQHELETSEGNAATLLRKAGTAQDAASAFALGYERPKGFLTGDINQVAGGRDRVAAALRLAGGGASDAIIAPGRVSANGIPYSDAQIKANPFLMSEYVHSIASDDKVLDRLGSTIGPALETQIKGGNVPDATTLGNFLQLAQRNPEKFGAQAETIKSGIAGEALGTAAVNAGGQTGQQVLDQAHALAQGGSLAQLSIGEAAQKSYDRQTKALKDTPFGEAARRGYIAREPAPIDFSTTAGVATLPQAMADRSHAALAIGSITGQPQLALAPDDLRQMASGMAGLPAPAVAQTLQAISTMQPQQIDALMANGEFKQTVLGLTRSGDPAKMNAAFSFLDAQNRRNPVAFDAADDGALKSLRAWQALGQFLPAGEVAKRMTTYNDPGQQKARDALEKKADEDLKTLDAGSVVGQLYASHVPVVGLRVPFTSPGGEAADGGPVAGSPIAAGAMAFDYKQAYKDLYAETGDSAAASKYAMEKLGNKYSVSSLNAGRVMAYAPDRENADGTGAYYPKVNGSFDWLRDQLKGDLMASAFYSDLRRSDPEQAGRVQTGRAMPFLLMPDETTQAEIAAKRAPSYKVIAQGDDGRFHVVQDQGGVAHRFYGDPKAAQAKAASDFTAHRANAAAVEATPDAPAMGGN